MRKYRFTLAVLLVSLTILVYIYNNILIPGIVASAEKQIRLEIDEKAMPKAKTAVVTGTKTIARYTVLTEDLIKSSIKFIDMPLTFMASNAAVSLEQLSGKICKEDLRPGEQINLDSLTTEKKWFSEFQRLKEYKISGIVAGEVKTGNIVDVVVSYNSGGYDVVVPKIKVYKLLDNLKPEPGQQIKATAEYTLIFAVDEEQYGELELAERLGKLETRLYLDESQPPSIKTFDTSKAAGRLGISNSALKTASYEISR